MSFGELFLKYPDLFPARASGQPWGDAEIVLDCAGGPYRFTGLSTTQAEKIRANFAEFVRTGADEQKPAIRLSVFRADEEDFTGAPYPDNTYTFETTFEQGAIRFAGRGFMARLDLRPELSATVWTSDDLEFVTIDFSNLFRLLVAHHLREIGGLLLHSSGVVIDGGAHIFFGYSGAGKTTVAKLALARGYEVISDDINLLVPADDGLRASRSPFTGTMGRTHVRYDSYPVRGLYSLVKGRENAIRPMTRAEAVCALVARSPFVNEDPRRTERLVDNLAKLVETVPTFALTFTKDGGFWELLHSRDREA